VLLDLDEADAVDAAGLQVLLRRRGRQLTTVDALVATVALRYDLTVLTTDGDFAHVPSLRTENWVTP
jgi:predicted nucleic acid-binding protein